MKSIKIANNIKTIIKREYIITSKIKLSITQSININILSQMICFYISFLTNLKPRLA